MPKVVRVAIWILGAALAFDIVGTLRLRSFSSASIGQVAIIILLFGGLLVAIAYRRNWARITFAFLWVASLPFSILAMSRAQQVDAGRVTISIGLTVLQAVGLTCLFMPRSADWYHHRDGAA